jgi:hypothetical protein
VPVAVKDQITRNDELLFYPNPVEDMLMISGKSVISEIRITDIQGRIVKIISPVSGIVNINLSGIAGGVYFVQVNQKNSLITEKIIKR